MARDKEERPAKLYYRIGEAAALIGVEPHVLRYWESEFPTIRPQKARSGQRVYSRKDVEKLARIKELLYAQRFTIAGARQRLRELGLEPAAKPAVAVGESSSGERERHSDEATRMGAAALRAALVAIREQAISLLREVDSSLNTPP